MLPVIGLLRTNSVPWRCETAQICLMISNRSEAPTQERQRKSLILDSPCSPRLANSLHLMPAERECRSHLHFRAHFLREQLVRREQAWRDALRVREAAEG